MITSVKGSNVQLTDTEMLQREQRNLDYMMELDSTALLQNYTQEAGRYQEFGKKKLMHGGWEDPSCQLRGHFLGHWLSAAAVRYNEDGNEELLGKANRIVHELRLCQIDNGGLWAASIPEKYFHWISIGKAVWAPHYTVHKTFMGLIDMYRYAGNEEALLIAVNFARWFMNYTDGKTREELDNILDFETGGMLEIWAELYEITGDEQYMKLIERYDRHRLFDPLLEGKDVLTNMHANTTVPEIIGSARVYEATGIERYRKIAEKYWELAVTKRGQFSTGGQTCGEIWTPMQAQAARLGDKNQEHCFVYNMIRLADILFRWTGDPKYQDYIEKNIYNGLMAQAYWKGNYTHGQHSDYPDTGLLTYFLPLRAGGRKGWASKTQDFFCCHGTLVQANAAHNQYIYYQNGSDIYTGQYFDNEAHFVINSTPITIIQKQDTLSGSFHLSSTSSAGQCINDVTGMYTHQPDCMTVCFKIASEEPAEFTLRLRIPAWAENASLMINGEPAACKPSAGSYLDLARTFQPEDELRLTLPMKISCVPLADDPESVAYTYGPIALAGLCDDERLLHTCGHRPEELLVHDNEKEWGAWKKTFKTRFQDHGIRFVPLCEIGYERYQVYFPLAD